MKCFKFLFTIIFLMLITASAYSKRHINLDGKWHKIRKSLEKELPIQAWIEDDNEYVSLLFEDDLGNVHVTVSDSFGTILYDQVIHTDESSSIIIPVKDMEGECTLSITDGKNHVFGEFSIY